MIIINEDIKLSYIKEEWNSFFLEIDSSKRLSKINILLTEKNIKDIKDILKKNIKNKEVYKNNDIFKNEEKLIIGCDCVGGIEEHLFILTKIDKEIYLTIFLKGQTKKDDILFNSNKAQRILEFLQR